jgi:monofunctional chorismate mutase
MSLRGIRGAITVASNSSPEIIAATKELLLQIVAENSVVAEDIASVIFSVTRDLNAEFPAVAARELGWEDTALLCTYEIEVPGSISSVSSWMVDLSPIAPMTVRSVPLERWIPKPSFFSLSVTWATCSSLAPGFITMIIV